MAKEKDDPSNTSLAYDYMLPKWTKINTLLAGTDAMRAAGEVFLPRHPEESINSWNERRESNVLLNMTRITLNSLVGRPFSSPIQIGEDVPDKLRDVFGNVDLRGTSLNRFARSWFSEGVAKGYAAVLVEFPKTPERPDGQPRTAADDTKDGLRPYVVPISTENIIGGYAEYINGQEVLQEVRIREEVVVRDGFKESIEEHIRILTPGRGRVYRKQREKTRNRTQWVLIEEYEYDLEFIPIVFFYSSRKGFMLSEPPLDDLADLNIRHWQSTSDQIAVLTVSRFPMLAVSGAVEADKMVVGPNRLLSVPDPNGRFYYVEHTGKAISVGREDLNDLEDRMAEYGASFLKRKSGDASATARALDSSEVTSSLEDMALGFQDALKQVIQYIGVWMGLPPDKVGSVSIKTDLTMTKSDDIAMTTLIAARKNRDISRHEFLRQLIEYEILPQTFDMEANEKAVVEEMDKIQKDLIAAKHSAPATKSGIE